MPDFDPTYVLEVIADRDQIEWFSPAPQTDGFLAGPADIYLRTSDDVVTWGWSIEPLPVDPGTRRFRRFRHPDGWAMLTDADDPETLFLPATTEIHAVVAPDGRIVGAVTADAGSAPGSGDAYSLQKAAEGDGEYRLEQAWPIEIVSAALALWCESFLNHTVAFSVRSATTDDLEAVRALVGEAEEPIGESGPLGHDAEVAELIEGFDDIFWFQADLTWPDRDDDEAFRDRIDVRIRDGATDTWLLSIEPLDGTPGSLRLLADGGQMVLDPGDPNVIRLSWNRLVLAVSVQETGFEPAGVAVPIGSAPGTEQWEELRRVAFEHPGSVVIGAPAWSETRVSHALTEWAEAWAGLSPRFVYDFDDPVSQAAIEANNLLEDAGPEARSVRTGTRQLCGHTEEASAAHEEPLPCGLPATAYYRDGDIMILVCDAHAPTGVKLTTLLRA